MIFNLPDPQTTLDMWKSHDWWTVAFVWRAVQGSGALKCTSFGGDPSWGEHHVDEEELRHIPVPELIVILLPSAGLCVRGSLDVAFGDRDSTTPPCG